MYKFEQCYKKARSQLKNITFFENLPNKVTFAIDLSLVLGSDGPERVHGPKLDVLRKTVADIVAATNHSEGGVIVEGCREGTKNKRFASTDLAKRCATIKMLRHLYLKGKRGGQAVWIYSPPEDYTEWMFDELKGESEDGLRAKLDEDDEVYAETEKDVMFDATVLALKWVNVAIARLGSPNDTTKGLVKHWFLDSDPSDRKVTRTCSTLLRGLQKIANTLNSNKLIYSDEPEDRHGGGWEDYAFVYSSGASREAMSVVYVQKALLDSGSSGDMWDSARCLIHELSHRELKTKDHDYRHDGGLRPSQGGLSERKAISNADNWSNFVTDLNGQIPVNLRIEWSQ